MRAPRHLKRTPDRLLTLFALLALAVAAGCRHAPGPEDDLSTPTIGVGFRRHPPPAPTGSAAVGSPGAANARFVDMSRRAGLTYRWRIDGPRPLDILQGIGNGCAFVDYDNDGALDVLLVGPRLGLFKGDGKGHFTDVTRAMGLGSLSGHFLGCAVGDYDNDGFEDVYVSGYHTGLLLHNRGGRAFTDVTERAGLAPQPWGTSCAWGDIDNDGRLDLYVGNYVVYGDKTDTRVCEARDGVLTACGPYHYPKGKGVLYHNDGGGRFSDVTQSSQVYKEHGWNLGAAFADYDDSGRASLYLANDGVGGDLFQNDGHAFRNMGIPSGTAFSGDSRRHAGMGTDWGDYDNDGRPDLVVGTFQKENKCVYHNEGGGLFQEVSDALTLTPTVHSDVTFGAKWLDYDNDGWLDLMLTNGHVQDNIARIDRGATYREATRLFHNDRGRLLVNVGDRAGADLAKPIVGRGVAVGDYDNDGRVDALVVDSEGAPLLLHNESAPVGHWLRVTLAGGRSNRDGYGARVSVTAGGRTLTRWCHADGSYLSSSDRRVLFGLGGAGRVESLTVRWPGGGSDTRRGLRADRGVVIRQGEPVRQAEKE